MNVKISGKSLRQLFHPCEANYIKGVCRGRCCEGSGGIMVTVHKSEELKIKSLGANVVDGFISADSRGLCPFKTKEGFCGIHGENKPFGCKASPFTLTKKSTLIVRNRYRLLRCFNCVGSIPAYEAHFWSLSQIFGESEAKRIVHLAKNGLDFINGNMPDNNYKMLIENDEAKRNLKK